MRRPSVCPSVCKHWHKSLLLAGKCLNLYQTCTRWFPAGPASRVCSRSKSRPKFTWYGHFRDFTIKQSLPLPGNGSIVNKLTTSLTPSSLCPFPFLAHPNPKGCEFALWVLPSHRETVCQTVCYAVWSHFLSLRVHTLWSTITLSFKTQYPAAKSNV